MEYLIQDTTLTGIADAIRAKTGGADPIPVADMAAQIAAITGGGSEESVVTLLGEQTLDFALNTTFNLYGAYIEPAPFVPVIGETYTVVWDGVEYECVAQDADAILAGTVFIGNAEAFGLNGNNEPFIIGGDASSGIGFFSLTDTDSSTHTVAIYQKASGGGGGSVEGIVYVTFMNGDVELCKTACMAGDSTIDPVEDGKIAVPTKDPSASTVYTFSGEWSLTDGGAADVMALKDVTEDRVVYAVYNESVRKYTINFWLSDGELHESLQVPYGTVPSPTAPEKDGYYFEGWSPELVAVTGDTDYYATWNTAMTFANASWAEIAAISESGEAANTFAIGDTKELVLTDGTACTIEIVGFNHDVLTADTSKTAGITCLVKEVPNIAFEHRLRISGVASKYTGWGGENCPAEATWCEETLYAQLLPEALRTVIKQVNKQFTRRYSTGSSQQITVGTVGNYCWYPSVPELGTPTGCGLDNSLGDGTCYARFQDGLACESLAAYMELFPLSVKGVSGLEYPYLFHRTFGKYASGSGVLRTAGIYEPCTLGSWDLEKGSTVSYQMNISTLMAYPRFGFCI